MGLGPYHLPSLSIYDEHHSKNFHKNNKYDGYGPLCMAAAAPVNVKLSINLWNFT